MEHIIGRAAARWAQSKNITAPAEFVARCDDPQLLLEVLAKMVADGTIDATALKQAREIVGCGYRGDLPEIRQSDDEASARLEKMLHDSRARYAKHVTVERCNLIRAAVPMLAESIASAGELGFVMARARRIARALYGECSFTMTEAPIPNSTEHYSLRVDHGTESNTYTSGLEADAWSACLEYLTSEAERRANWNRNESERLAKQAAAITAAVAGADSR